MPSLLRNHWKKITLIATGLLLLAALAFWLWLPIHGLGTAKRFLRWKFNDVQQITTSELATQLQSANTLSCLISARARNLRPAIFPMHATCPLKTPTPKSAPTSPSYLPAAPSSSIAPSATAAARWLAA